MPDDNVLTSGVVEMAAGSALRLPIDFGNEPRLIQGASLDANGDLVLATIIATQNVTCSSPNVTISLIQLDYPYQVSAKFECDVAGEYQIVFTVVLNDDDATEIVRKAPLRVL